MKNSDKSKDKFHSLIEAFDHLGVKLRYHVNSKATHDLSEAGEAARIQNAWFTTSNVHSAFCNWGDILRRETITTGYRPTLLQNGATKLLDLSWLAICPWLAFTM